MTGDPSPADAAAASSKPRKRRWLQFSLRSLLIFTLLCAIGAALLARKIEKKRREREAVQMILEGGGTVLFDYQHASGKLNRSAEPSGPTWLRGLLGENFFSEVHYITLDNSPKCKAVLVGPIQEFNQLEWLDLLGVTSELQVNDAVVDRLQGMSKLKTLMISGRGITDVSLAKLSSFPELVTLKLSYTGVTDEGMATIAKFSQIESLSLDSTAVGDQGIANLTPLKNLRQLILGRTKITDAGISHLGNFKKLTTLWLNDTRITNAGLARLQKYDNLEHLEIAHTAVDGEGLEFLDLLYNLQSLDIRGTNVSRDDKKLAELRKVLPKCSIAN